MDGNVVFLDCPAYLDGRGKARCGLPAEVEYWYTVRSTAGPLESAKIKCPRGHWFNGPVESLTRGFGPVAAVSRTRLGEDAVGCHQDLPAGGRGLE
jgi:hypothetical protein